MYIIFIYLTFTYREVPRPTMYIRLSTVINELSVGLHLFGADLSIVHYAYTFLTLYTSTYILFRTECTISYFKL